MGKERVKVEGSKGETSAFPFTFTGKVPHQAETGRIVSKVGKIICLFHTH